MIVILVMSLLACGGPVVKRVNSTAVVQEQAPKEETAASKVTTTVKIPVVTSIVTSTQAIEYVRLGDPDKPVPSYAGKLAFDGSKWRRQIVLYNGATEDMVKDVMRSYVSSLVSNRDPNGKWDSFGYWLMDKYGNTLTPPSDVTNFVYTPTQIAAPTAPPVTQNIPSKPTAKAIDTTFRDLMISALDGVTISNNTITLSSDLLFDSGKDVLKPEGLRILSVICRVIKGTYPDQPVIIEGHTDNVPIKPKSKFRDNNDLSLARAEAVWLYLINNGLSQANLYAQGFGESSPIAPNNTEDGRRQNRRVVIKVVPK